LVTNYVAGCIFDDRQPEQPGYKRARSTTVRGQICLIVYNLPLNLNMAETASFSGLERLPSELMSHIVGLLATDDARNYDDGENDLDRERDRKWIRR
jgi:hypothetical protein